MGYAPPLPPWTLILGRFLGGCLGAVFGVPAGPQNGPPKPPQKPPCGAKSRGSGGAPPTHLILLRNQRRSPGAERRRRGAVRGARGGGWRGRSGHGVVWWGWGRPLRGPPWGQGGKEVCVPPAGCRRGGLQEKGMMLAQLGAHLRLRQELRLRREQSRPPKSARIGSLCQLLRTPFNAALHLRCRSDVCSLLRVPRAQLVRALRASCHMSIASLACHLRCHTAPR